MPTHTFAAKSTPVQLADLDAALYEAARSLPYWPLSINTQTSTPYVLVLSDANQGKVLRANLGTACQVTLPPNADVAIQIGARIPIDQWGAGQVTVVGGSGVTVRGTPTLKTRAQYSRIWAEKQADNEWLIWGDLAAS